MSSQTVHKSLADYVINTPPSVSSSVTPGYSDDLFGCASTGVTAGARPKAKASYRASSGYDHLEDLDGMECEASEPMMPMSSALVEECSDFEAMRAPASKSGAIFEKAMDREYADYAISKTKAAVSNYRAKKKMMK